MNFRDRFFEKYSDIKFHENSSSGIRAVPCGRTYGQTVDRHGEANNLFQSFVKAPVNGQILGTLKSQSCFGNRVSLDRK